MMMNNRDLSYKLTYILNELGLNKTEMLKECRKYNPSLSKPTLLNAINGKNKSTPSIETLNAIIMVCKMSKNPKLKSISYDFLLNENINEITAEHAAVYQEIGLSDDVIARLKQFNHPLYFNYGNIINYFFIHTPSKYWEYLEQYKRTMDIMMLIEKDHVQISELLNLFQDDVYLLLLNNKFKNLYDLYIKLESTKDIHQINQRELYDLLDVVRIHYLFLLQESNNKFYKNIQ